MLGGIFGPYTVNAALTGLAHSLQAPVLFSIAEDLKRMELQVDVDEAELADALRAGRIAGGAADVFAQQPLPPDHPFWTLPNFIVYPNIGGRSDKFVEQTATVLEPNIQAFIDGRLKDLRNLVAR